MELFIAFLLFMVVAFGVLYNIAKRLYGMLRKNIGPRQNTAIDAAAKAKELNSNAQQTTIHELIAFLESSRYQTLPPQYKETYIVLKNELTDSTGILIFDKIFRWEINNGCYTLVYAPIYEDMKLHYHNFLSNLDKRLIMQGDEISLDVDYHSMGELSCIPSPAEGILEYAVPSFISADFRCGINILKIDTNREAIEAFEREMKEEARQREEMALQAEKQRIADKIKMKQKRYDLEKVVRQELIDNGELFGERTKRPPIPRELVDAVYRRDGGRCVYCGSTENLQLDHIIPFSKGGATTIENLQLLCQKCNLEKSNKIG